MPKPREVPPRAPAGRRVPRARWLIAGGCVVAVAAAGVIVVAASGSGSSTKARVLTSEEANRLAITRFRNYETGGRAVTITVPGTAGDLVITGSVDYRAKLGYGVVHGTGRDTSSDGLIEWTATSVLVDPMPSVPATAPAAPPNTGWYSRQLQQTGSSLDSSLAIALNLGSDRPDNAQLLPQNGAMWVGQDNVAGHQVTVMTGPTAQSGSGSGLTGTVRYWVGQDGTMYRVQAAVASSTQPAVIEFDTQKYAPVPAITASQ
ncbi:hypothetical protein [Catenulispora pinisilvae]|uniref:hypothetical protein n=1 Tax=Catenulispora pinisilvae TaxID=2705253 RepID=UPI001E4F1CD1|nr:hypothetical protein [Catenulispora pinisilvae]